MRWKASWFRFSCVLCTNTCITYILVSFFSYFIVAVFIISEFNIRLDAIKRINDAIVVSIYSMIFCLIIQFLFLFYFEYSLERIVVVYFLDYFSYFLLRNEKWNIACITFNPAWENSCTESFHSIEGENQTLAKQKPKIKQKVIFPS